MAQVGALILLLFICAVSLVLPLCFLAWSLKFFAQTFVRTEESKESHS